MRSTECRSSFLRGWSSAVRSVPSPKTIIKLVRTVETVFHAACRHLSLHSVDRYVGAYRHQHIYSLAWSLSDRHCRNVMSSDSIISSSVRGTSRTPATYLECHLRPSVATNVATPSYHDAVTSK